MNMLCKLAGRLVLAKFRKSDGPGHCPICHGTEFEEAPYGWTECCGCHDFAILTEQLNETHDITSID